jgi:hypothetical protein
MGDGLLVEAAQGAQSPLRNIFQGESKRSVPT